MEDKRKWELYVKQEIASLTPILKDLGFILDKEQVHIAGERYLMSGRKLVLLGKRASDGMRVVIKASSHPEGIEEIEKTHSAHGTLHNLKFSYRLFFSPGGIVYTHKDGYKILITEYVEQDKHFIDHDLKKQFFLTLRAFETQESAHATAYSHKKTIRNNFKEKTATEYIDSFKEFKADALQTQGDNKKLHAAFNQGENFLTKNKDAIELYCGFLTHSDFAPHNIRVVDNDIYLLDHTSIYFANKYEGWARFINFMTQHNPELEHMLVEFVRNNRTPEEYLSLRLMRVYKIGFLLRFYANSLKNAEGDLYRLNETRLNFWADVLLAILRDEYIEKEVVEKLVEKVDSLRSDEEKRRQKEIYSAK